MFGQVVIDVAGELALLLEAQLFKCTFNQVSVLRWCHIQLLCPSIPLTSLDPNMAGLVARWCSVGQGAESTDSIHLFHDTMARQRQILSIAASGDYSNVGNSENVEF